MSDIDIVIIGAGVKVTTNEALSSTALLHGLSAIARIVNVTDPFAISVNDGK